MTALLQLDFSVRHRNVTPLKVVFYSKRQPDLSIYSQRMIAMDNTPVGHRQTKVRYEVKPNLKELPIHEPIYIPIRYCDLKAQSNLNRGPAPESLREIEIG